MENNEILLSKNYLGEYVGEITREIDKYSTYKNSGLRVWHSYISKYSDNIWVIRVPGATRGKIVTDSDDKILSISFYEDTCFGKLVCFEREVETEIPPKFIGKKLVIKKD